MLWKWSKKERKISVSRFLIMLDNASNNLYNGNRGRNFEDVNYDKTSEEKYSRDIDYSEYLEFKCDFEEVNQLMFYML